jgi:hypothetical protein
MSAYICLQNKSLVRVLESFEAIGELLGQQGLNSSQFETLCISTIRAACETIISPSTNAFSIVHDFGKVVIALCACESKGLLDLREMICTNYVAAAVFKSRRGESDHLRSLSEGITSVLNDRSPNTSVDASISRLIHAIDPPSQDNTRFSIHDMLSETHLNDITAKGSDGSGNLQILQFFREPRNAAELAAEIQKIASEMSETLATAPEQVYEKLLKKQVYGIWSRVGERLFDCKDPTLRWRCIFGALAGGMCSFKFMLAVYMVVVYYREFTTRKKEITPGAAAEATGVDRIKQFALQQQQQGMTVPPIFNE